MIILEKIKKLLKLGKSPNQHEAAAALARAFELARKHQIDLSSVDVEDEAIERLLIRHGARLSFERSRILGIIKHFFRVDVIICPPNAALIGRATDLAIAHYVHDFLLRNIRDGLREYQKSMRRKLSPTRRANFIQGWIYGVATKLKEVHTAMVVEDSRYALVTVDADPKVTAASAEMYPNTETRKSRPIRRKDKSALMSGYCEGQSVDIRQPLQGPAPLTLNQ